MCISVITYSLCTVKTITQQLASLTVGSLLLLCLFVFCPAREAVLSPWWTHNKNTEYMSIKKQMATYVTSLGPYECIAHQWGPRGGLNMRDAENGGREQICCIMFGVDTSATSCSDVQCSMVLTLDVKVYTTWLASLRMLQASNLFVFCCCLHWKSFGLTARVILS